MNNNKKRKNIFYSNLFTVESIAYYQQNIIAHSEDIVFKNDPKWFLSDQQKEGLLAIQNNDRVAIKSGKGPGKTALVVNAVLWFMNCFENPKVLCTAPTYGTLKTALWAELSLWLSRSLVEPIYEITEKSMYLKESPKNHFTLLRTAKDAEAAQGAHADNMLIIIDEASGVKEEIFEAFDSTLTGRNNKFVMIGNPTRTSGPFYDVFNNVKLKKRWVTLTFDAEQSPFVKKDQIQYYEEKYGRHHDLFRVMVKGEFPKGSPDAFIELSSVHAAVDRWEEVQSNGEIEIGLDVARFGNDLTVLYWRHGYKVYPAKTLAKSSVVETAQLALDTVEEIRKATGYERTIRIKVDDSGVGGGVVDILKTDRSHNIEVVPCNFGGAGNNEYQNEASIMWGNVKSIINIIGLPEDQHLIEELSSRRWRLSPSGKIMLEPKSEYKKEFKSSPDRADALVLCFAQKAPEETVLKKLDVLDPQTVKVLHYVGEERYGAVYYGKDMTISVAYTAWDGRRLYIYDEFLSGDSVVSVAMNIIQHQGLTKIIGNDRMFGKNADGLDIKYSKYGVRLTENYNYDEMSGIDALITLTLQKRLIINPGCVKTIEQLSGWKIDNKRVEQEREYGLCYALTLITSFLKRKITHMELPMVMSSYVDKRGVTGFKSVKDEKSWLLM